MVYFIQCGDDGPVKIGYALRDVRQRIATLQTGCPYELQVIHVMADGTRSDEAGLHRLFDQYRLRGEWFDHAVLEELVSLGIDQGWQYAPHKAPRHVGEWAGTASLCWRPEDRPLVVRPDGAETLRLISAKDVPLRTQQATPPAYPLCGALNWPVCEPHVDGHTKPGKVFAKYKCHECGFGWVRWFDRDAARIYDGVPAW